MPFPSSGDLMDLGIKHAFPALASEFFTTIPIVGNTTSSFSTKARTLNLIKVKDLYQVHTVGQLPQL